MLVVDQYMMRVQVTHNMWKIMCAKIVQGRHRSKRYWSVIAGFFLTAFFKHWGHIGTFPVTWDLICC